MPRKLRASDYAYRYRSMKARGRRWQPHEDTLLVSNLQDRKVITPDHWSVLAVLLERKVVSVKQRASYMGLTK